MSKLKKKPIIFFIIAFIVLYTIIYIIPKVNGALVSSYIAEYGQLTLSDETTAYFVRNETVYLADESGSINYYFEEDSLVRKGARILEVLEDSSLAAETSESGEPPVTSSEFGAVLSRMGDAGKSQSGYETGAVGVVSYFADGYESVITPKTMGKQDYSFFRQISQKDVVALKRETAIEGEPVFKIVDRTKWYLVCFVDGEHIDRYTEGSSVRVVFEDDTIAARVYKTEADGDFAKVILATDYYYTGFVKTREAEVSLVTYDESGIIIENSSIAEEKGQTGVYVKSKNDEYFFVPVKIYATDGEKSLIADDFYYDAEKDGEMVMTVDVYDEILKNADAKDRK